MGSASGGSTPPATVPGRSALRTLALASFVSSYDRFAMAPLLLVIAADMRVSLGSVAAAAGGYYLAYGLTQPVWGLLSERRGRVATMRLGLLGAAVAGLASAAAPDLGTLAVTRGVTGGCLSAVIPAALVYVGDSWPAADRQRPLSDVLAATSLGTTGGTLGAGLLAQFSTWRAAFAVAALAGAGLWVALRRLPEPVGQRSAERPARLLRRVLTTPWALVVLAVAAVEGVVLVGAFVYLAPALQSTGVAVGVAGAVAGVFGVGVLGGAQVVKVLVGRLTAARLLAIGGISILFGWAVLAFGIGVGTVLGAGVLLGVGWAFFHSTMQSWATDVVPTARATAVSLFVAALFVGGAAGTALVAPLADRHAFGAIFLIAMVLAAPLTAVAAGARSRYARR
ncbi:MFS transporter [Pseudonocardia saturnea]